MKRTLTVAFVFAMLFPPAGTAQEGNALATRPGWELGVQAANYRYLEPDFAKLSGNRAGIVAAGTSTSAAGVFSRFDFRFCCSAWCDSKANLADIQGVLAVGRKFSFHESAR